jgi:hypothetical protein
VQDPRLLDLPRHPGKRGAEMTHAELLDLLREAQPWIQVHAPIEATDLLMRMNAALAERQDKPPCSCGQPYPCMKGCPDCCHSQGYLDYCQGDRHAERQDSAKNVVEWRPGEQRVFLDGVSLCIFYLKDGFWMWSAYWQEDYRTEQGTASTEAEAQQAALDAARRLA